MAKRTKEALIEAFLELIEDEDFDKISVTDLVEKCGISRQTFYYHFEDVQAMIRWAFDNETKAVCEADDMSDAEQSYIDFFKRYDTMLRKALKSTKLIFVFNIIDKSFYDCITAYLSTKREEQSFGKNADYVISYTAGAFTSLVIKTIQNETSDYETIISNLSASLQGK